jgi:seryl-tRNA synthetase
MAASIVDELKAKATALGQQIRAIKQGGAASSSGEGTSLESITAELKELKVQLAKAEKEQKAEEERNKIVIKVPKVGRSDTGDSGAWISHDAHR